MLLIDREAVAPLDHGGDDLLVPQARAQPRDGGLDGVRVVAMHGTADERTYPRRTATGVDELIARGIDATFVPVPDGDHAMLDHIGLWQRSALDFVGERLSALRGA
mgnify:CR=1 FL=1